MIKISQKEFKAVLEKYKTPIKEEIRRFNPIELDETQFSDRDTDFYIHEGDIIASGEWKAPGQVTLIAGNLMVNGFIYTDEEPKVFGEGGVLIILGNVECEYFANTYGKATFIDGNLFVKQLLVNDFENSALVVLKDLKTKFFYGRDIWADVGGNVNIEFGDGYCLPLNQNIALSEQPIGPTHDKKTSIALLNVDNPNNGLAIDAYSLVKLIQSGKSVFK